MLPSSVIDRLLREDQVLGLLMKRDGSKRTIYFRIETAEGPNDLMDFSLGAATAQAVAGTGWSEIQDSASRYYLEPGSQKIIYHFFFGVSPGQAWIYRRYPSNRDLNSLIATRAIGDPIGYVDGNKSPYRVPSPLTEMFSMYGMHPAFLGYNPFLEPVSITVRLNFFVVRYDVTVLGLNPVLTGGKGLIVADNDRMQARVRPVGGHELIDVPSWIESAVS